MTGLKGEKFQLLHAFSFDAFVISAELAFCNHAIIRHPNLSAVYVLVSS